VEIELFLVLSNAWRQIEAHINFHEVKDKPCLLLLQNRGYFSMTGDTLT